LTRETVGYVEVSEEQAKQLTLPVMVNDTTKPRKDEA
jgi:hypothetical protein